MADKRIETDKGIENMTDNQLYRVISKVSAEEGSWHNEGGRLDYLDRLVKESERRTALFGGPG